MQTTAPSRIDDLTEKGLWGSETLLSFGIGADSRVMAALPRNPMNKVVRSALQDAIA